MKMATYVSSAHIQQSTRVRNHIQSHRDQFLTYNYITSEGINTSAYPIWINLCLITSKVRPAFMIQWIDFLDPQDYENIMQLLTEYRNSLYPDDLDYRLYFITDQHGIIVTTYYTYFKQGLKTLHREYVEHPDSNIQLGKILGYPSAEGNNMTATNEKYIGLNMQAPEQYEFNIFVKICGLDPEQIIGMGYQSQEIRKKLYDFYNRIKVALKVYDPEVRVTIQDTQGSLLEDIETYIPEYRSRIDISEKAAQKYRDYVNSIDRLHENWNQNFDDIFTIGYNYHI